MNPKELEKVQEILEKFCICKQPTQMYVKCEACEVLSIIKAGEDRQATKEAEGKTKSMQCSHGNGSDCPECKKLGAEGELYSGIDIDENKLPAEADLQCLERAVRDVVIYYDRQAFPNKELKRSVDALAALLALREKSTNSTQTRETINLPCVRGNDESAPHG